MGGARLATISDALPSDVGKSLDPVRSLLDALPVDAPTDQPGPPPRRRWAGRARPADVANLTFDPAAGRFAIKKADGSGSDVRDGGEPASWLQFPDPNVDYEVLVEYTDTTFTTTAGPFQITLTFPASILTHPPPTGRAPRRAGHARRGPGQPEGALPPAEAGRARRAHGGGRDQHEAGVGDRRHSRGLGPIPADQSLSQRFVAVKAAWAGLDARRTQEAFTRVRELMAGPASVDVTLPRGSAEIHFFTATATTAANVESPWPSNVDQLQAAAAPRVVAPGTPDVSAEFTSLDASARVRLRMSVASTVPVGTFEVHRTRNTPAAESSASMGPAVAVVAAAPTGDPPSASGLRYAATWEDAVAGDWRPYLYRVVAVPTLGAPEREQGLLGRRSPDSPLVPVTLPPTSPPDLSAPTADDFGAAARRRRAAPLDRRLLRSTAVSGASCSPPRSPSIHLRATAPSWPRGPSRSMPWRSAP